MHPRFIARARNVVGVKRQEILDHLADAISALDRICRAAQELSICADRLRSLRAQFEFVDIESKEAAALAESVRLSMSEIKARLDALSNAQTADLRLVERQATVARVRGVSVPETRVARLSKLVLDVLLCRTSY